MAVAIVQVLKRNEHDTATEKYLWHRGLAYESQEAFLRAQGKRIIYTKNNNKDPWWKNTFHNII